MGARICFVATSMLVTGAALLAHCLGAAAQPAAPNPADELRPLYANAADVAEGKRLADACSGCHGQNGISTSPSVPNLAGQRPAYLYLELKAYQSGANGVGPMTDAVKFLSNDALINTAAFFASLEPAQPSAPGGTGAAAAVDPVQAGKTAAAACAGCHGETGISKTPGVPSLVGLDPQYLVAAMKAYKSGQRKNDTMKAMLGSTSDAGMEAIALYYALQQPARAQTPAPGDAAAGAAAAAGCAGCHGDRGASGNPAIPSLAGQDAEYLAAALGTYKAGARSDDTMKGIASGLGAGAVRNMAAYYAGLEPQPPNVRKPATTEEWAQKCDRCHGINGNSADPRLPALAGQRTDYLERALRAFKSGERKSPQMAAMSAGLTEEDITNLAAYYAGQRARAAIFIIVPSK
jgi:cytochrome c553